MTIPASTPTGFQPADAERVQNQADLNALLGAFSGDVLKAANGGTGLGAAVALQATTPASQQTGNLNVSGTAIIASKIGVGGTTAPGTPLEVNGTQAVPPTSGGTSGAMFRIKNAAGGAIVEIGQYPSGTQTNFAWIQADNVAYGNYYGLVLEPNGGNVGIGKIPAVPLDVNGAAAISGKMTISGGVALGVVSKTANYGAGDADYLILCNATGGAFTITLPAATGTGRILAVIKTDASINAVTVARAGADTIEGVNSKALALQYDKITLIADGTSVWYDLGKGLI